MAQFLFHILVMEFHYQRPRKQGSLDGCVQNTHFYTQTWTHTAQVFRPAATFLFLVSFPCEAFGRSDWCF